MPYYALRARALDLHLGGVRLVGYYRSGRWHGAYLVG